MLPSEPVYYSPYFEQDVLKLQDALRIGIEDCLGDSPELSEGEVWHNIAISVALDAESEVRAEFYRREGIDA